MAAVVAVGRIVLGRPPDALVNWQRLVEAADVSLTLPALWPALARAEHGLAPPDEVLALAEVAHALNADRNAALLRQLEAVASRLNAAGVEPLLLKGACHLVEGLWPTGGARAVGDIDILVRASEIDRAFRCLAAASPASASPVPPRRPHRPRVRHCPPLRAEGGPAEVEIHDTLLDGALADAAADAALVERAQGRVIGGARVRVPSPDDQVMIAALHTTVGSDHHAVPDVNLRDLLDIAFLERRHGEAISWPTIAQRLRARGAPFTPRLVDHQRVFFTGAPRRMSPAGRADPRILLWHAVLMHDRPWRLAHFARNLSRVIERALGDRPEREKLWRSLRDPDRLGRAFRFYLLGERS